MFTGIISDSGTVIDITGADDQRISISCNYDTTQIIPGDSIACDGVCLTVVTINGQDLAFDVSRETLNCTTIGGWETGHKVNLEQALRAGDKLGGHLVSGHVDCTASIFRRDISGDSLIIGVEYPQDISRFIAKKGSVTLNGVSLTVNEVEENRFLVNIVPHTQTHTNLGNLQPGDNVNLEVDIIARYLARNIDTQYADA